MYRHRSPGSAQILPATLLGVIATVLVGCGGGGEEETAAQSAAPNRAPTISGSPATSITVGSAYSFTPSASDADGDSLTYSVQNKPGWASFNQQNGALTGTPSSAGTYADIVITVSDGNASMSLASFGIVVNAATATGALTVSWDPPTTNSDGSTLTNLAGYRISYGTSPSALSQTVQVANPGLTSYMIDNLASGTWHFSMKSYTSTGIESAATAVVSAVVP